MEAAAGGNDDWMRKISRVRARCYCGHVDEYDVFFVLPTAKTVVDRCKRCRNFSDLQILEWLWTRDL